MKLISILNKFNKVSNKDDETSFNEFVDSLKEEDLKKLKEFGKVLIDIADTQTSKRELLK